MKKTCKANLPAMIFLFALLILWQAGAMGLDAAYICRLPPRSWRSCGSCGMSSSPFICPPPCW
ncbi:MAG: hypothetical protein ACLTYN_09615 [Dysosmobacter welbionis]